MAKGSIVTYDELEAAGSAAEFCADALNRYTHGELWRNAVDANEYYRQRNVTISRFVRKLYSATGASAEDFTASKLRVASNLFKRLNVQRCMYSLGKGVFLSVLPLGVYQGAITLLARFILPWMTDALIEQMSCVGSVLIFAVSLNMIRKDKIKVGNLLPAVFLPAVFYLLARFFPVLYTL